MSSHLFRRNRPVGFDRAGMRRFRREQEAKEQARVEAWVKRKLVPIIDDQLVRQLGRRSRRSPWGRIEVRVNRSGVVHVTTKDHRIGQALDSIYGADRSTTERREEYEDRKVEPKTGELLPRVLKARYRETIIQPSKI